MAKGVARVMRILLVLLALAAPAALRAQAAPADSLRTVLEHARERSWTLRVLQESDTLTGRVFRLTPDAVELGAATLELASVLRVERRQTRGSGALLGAAIGGVVFGLAGYGLPCDGAYDLCSGQVFSAGVGALLGVVLGGLVGEAASSKTWQPVWSAR